MAAGSARPIDVLLSAALLRHPMTGIGRYTHRLAAGLERHPGIGRVRYFDLFGVGAERPRVMASPSRALVNRVVNLPVAAGLSFALRRAIFRIACARAGASLYHETNYLLMPFPGKCVATICDLSYLHYPQLHPAQRVRRMEKWLPETLRRADHLITISDFVRRELLRIFGVAGEKVTTIHLGIDEAFRARSLAECAPVVARYGLSGTRYLLSLGTLEPRKNVAALIAAYSRLPTRLQEEHPLVVAGMKGWRAEALERRIDALARQGRLRAIGYVPEEELPFVYGAAHAFAYPSLYEGFGFPPLEAMACGVPVLISNRASLPEVVGEEGLRVEPEDVEALTEGLKTLLTDPGFRGRAAAEGPKRSARFSWSRCVDRTVEVYRRVLDAGRA